MSDQMPNTSTINKIRKLMALADKKSGATEHEAIAATAKVQELLQVARVASATEAWPR